jgi:hypothetical protein
MTADGGGIWTPDPGASGTQRLAGPPFDLAEVTTVAVGVVPPRSPS